MSVHAPAPRSRSGPSRATLAPVVTPLTIGILGAGRIAPFAVIRPARDVEGVEVVAVAARDGDRAAAYAKKHGIPASYGGYDALIEDPAIGAIYNPLPNSHHARWTIRALEAGKHVLCEKPIAANADEARAMADAARRAGRVLMEAFHWRYHPLAARMIDTIRGGAIGEITRVEADMCVPFLDPWDIRYDLALAGGAMMDVGGYAVSLVRHLSGMEPEVVSSQVKLRRPEVDRAAEAELRFPNGATGRLRASLLSWRLLSIRARVVGTEGEVSAFNPIGPHVVYHRLTVRTKDGVARERVPGEPTYTCQLRAFLAAVREGAPIPTDGEDGVKNMAVIDAVYRAAGLAPRVGA